VVDDPRFRGFDPQARRDLLAEPVYKSAFGQLLDQVHATLPIIVDVMDSLAVGAPMIGPGSLRRSGAQLSANEDAG